MNLLALVAWLLLFPLVVLADAYVSQRLLDLEPPAGRPRLLLSLFNVAVWLGVAAALYLKT